MESTPQERKGRKGKRYPPAGGELGSLRDFAARGLSATSSLTYRGNPGGDRRTSPARKAPISHSRARHQSGTKSAPTGTMPRSSPLRSLRKSSGIALVLGLGRGNRDLRRVSECAKVGLGQIPMSQVRRFIALALPFVLLACGTTGGPAANAENASGGDASTGGAGAGGTASGGASGSAGAGGAASGGAASGGANGSGGAQPDPDGAGEEFRLLRRICG